MESKNAPKKQRKKVFEMRKFHKKLTFDRVLSILSLVLTIIFGILSLL